jgi:lipopolysaccharide transport system ATP-binding protein
MSVPILQINNVGKAYREYASEFNRIASWFGASNHPSAEHWVLRGVSFNLHAGEAIGIVGQNGAGKSTLLKLITGTLQPSEGHVVVNGRIAAILELGMGFNPELTGRQNARHAAGLMGFSAAQIDAFLPELEAFAEIGEYFDHAVRTYSSGMQMRVAFAVATAMRPEVLIIDEALSVGDTYFQHKSFNRIREFQQQGTTLLFVSHDKSAIQKLCDRVVLLNAGQLIMQGEPEAVMDFYNALIAEKESQTIRQEIDNTGKTQTISGTGEATVIDIALLNEHNERLEVVNVGQRVTLRLKVQVQAKIPELVVGYMLKDRLGQAAFGTNTHHLKQALLHLEAGETLEYRFTFDANLGEGSYSIAVALHTQDSHVINNYEWRDLALVFTVINGNHDPFVGMAWLPPECECVR